MTSPRVLFVGLDAADPGLLAKGCAEGWLPVLEGLRRAGAWAPVSVPRGFGDGAIWPSAFFGVHPARHGRYFNQQLRPGTYVSTSFVEDKDFYRKPVWEYLSEAGRRVAVIDMVKAPLSKNLNGIQIVDWTVHSRYGAPRSWPAGLISEVVSRFGPDPFDGSTDIFRERTAEEYKTFRDAMIDRVGAKAALCERLLKQESWDLFAVGFGDPHDIGHQCWHLHDPTHSMYDARWVERFGDPVKDVYAAVDRALGTLLEHAGPQTTTVVFAGPGMGPNYSGNFLLEKILRRIDGRPDRDRNAIPHAIVKRAPFRGLRRLAERINHAKGMYSMRRRRCFSVPHNEGAGAIRLNVIGREPAGLVAPGAEFAAARDAIIRDLLDIVDVDTGKPIFREVIRIADEGYGERSVELPDLFAVWAPHERPIRAVSSDKIGTVTGSPVAGARPGDHNWDCALVVQGPTMAEQTQLRDGIKVEDLAPTLAALLDIELPDSDGAPLLRDAVGQV